MRFGRIFLMYLLMTLVLFFEIKPIFATSNSDTLVDYWKMDEATQGSSAVDSSGDGHSLTPNGTGGGPSFSTTIPSAISFPNSHSAQFNGTDQYFTLADNSDYDGNAVTISVWVRFNTVNSNYRTIAAKWQIGAKQQYVIQLNSDNKIGVFTGDGSNVSSSVLESTASISANTWYHIAATISGTSDTIYVTPMGGSTTTNTGSGTSPGTSNIEFTVGSKKNSGGTYVEFLDGYIDDLRLYKRALSSTEVATLASGTHTSATWTGTTSTNWETASNWNINAIPDPYTFLTIPQVTNPPIMSADESAAGLTVNSGATLDRAGFTLTLNDSGGESNNGLIYANGNPPLSAPHSDQSALSCTSSAPNGIPNLFQTLTNGNSVKLTFTTVPGSSGYQISYGLTPDANQYGENFDYSGPLWILDRDIHELAPNSAYYFKIRATAGCNAGNWSNVVKVNTDKSLTNVSNVLGLATKQPASCTYQVQAEDSLWKIAQTQLGSGIKYQDILNGNAALSKTSILPIGQTITLCP